MNDIHVGEYIRTKDGCIEKVTQDLFDELYIDEEGEIEIVIGCDIEGASVYDMITKHSFNIIDLIEIDDYVNGIKITKIYDNDKDKFAFGFSEDGFEGETSFYNEDIKAIVTKERFKLAEYEVKKNEWSR